MYLDFVLFLRCDCSHVALFICLLPVSIFVAPKYPVRGIAICLEEGTGGSGIASRGRRGVDARLRDEYLWRTENFVFFSLPPALLFSVYLRVVPFFVHHARTVDFSYEFKAITCISSRFWDSALFALHKALIRWCETAGISDSFIDSLLDRRQRFARSVYRVCLPCSRLHRTACGILEGKPNYGATYRRRIVATPGHFAWQNG